MTNAMPDAPLWMLQLQPDPFRAAAWMAQHGVSRPGHDDGYGWHALLKAAFGAHAPQPFRVIEPTSGRPGEPAKPPFILAYSRVASTALLQHAQTFADPSVVAALRLEPENVSAKQMPTAFMSGQRFGFEVLVRPTVRQDRDGNRKASREKDAFLAALDKLPPRDDRANLDRDTVYRAWLAQRLEPAVRLEHADVAQRTRGLLLRRGAEEGDRTARPLKPVGALTTKAGQGGGGPLIIVTGILTVSDPAAFPALIARGVGRHRAFGFGMLLLKPSR